MFIAAEICCQFVMVWRKKDNNEKLDEIKRQIGTREIINELDYDCLRLRRGGNVKCLWE